MTDQCTSILQHLEEYGSIEPIAALDLYGCFRLAARISDLRRRGHVIRTEIVESEDGKRWARYCLQGDWT